MTGPRRRDWIDDASFPAAPCKGQMSESSPLVEQVPPVHRAIATLPAGLSIARPGVPRIVPIGEALAIELRRAEHVAGVSRAPPIPLAAAGLRETIRRLTFPRPDVWCIVDVVEPTGVIHRLPIVHAD